MAKKLLILVIPIILVSCGTPIISYNSMKELEKSQDYETVIDKLNEKPKDEFEISYNNKTYQVLIYNMKVGVSAQYQYNSSGHGHYVNVPVYTDYAFLFYENKLVYWGFIYEFKREDDKDLNKIAEVIYNQIK